MSVLSVSAIGSAYSFQLAILMFTTVWEKYHMVKHISLISVNQPKAPHNEILPYVIFYEAGWYWVM